MSLILKKIIFYILRILLPRFYRMTTDKIIFISEGHSGCNAAILYKFMKNIQHSYKLKILSNKNYNQNSLKQFFSRIKILSSANLIITTHGPIIIPGRKTYDLWHSVHLKTTGVMEKGIQKTLFKSSWQRCDSLLSYSLFYTTTMNACFLTDPKKFVITGAPRNDLLFSSHGQRLLNHLTGNSCKKYIFFAPTFRLGYGTSQGEKKFSNLFGFEEFDSMLFNSFLVEYNLVLIYKLHPNEEPFESEYTNKLDSKNCFHMSDKILSKENIDLYEVLNGFDVLVTDYSGIFFDYLLLNRPCIFTPVDLDAYINSRGFLYGPYDSWTPGPKVVTQEELQKQILNSIEYRDDRSDDRVRLRGIIHRYIDGKSCERVLENINLLLQ